MTTTTLQPIAEWQTATGEVNNLPPLEGITVTVMRTRTGAVELVDVQTHSAHGTDQVIVTHLEVVSHVMRMDPHHVVGAALDALDSSTDTAHFLRSQGFNGYYLPR